MLRANPHQIFSEYEELGDDPAVQRADYRTYLLDGVDGQYLLQNAQDAGEIYAAHRLMQSLQERGFTNLVPIVPTVDGEPVASRYGGPWFLQPYYPPAELNTEEEILQLARLLAAFHLAIGGDEEGAMVHGRLKPGVIRKGLSGELLLDGWDGAEHGNAADDLMPLLLLAARQGPGCPVSALDAYTTVRHLQDDERSRINDLVAHCSPSTLQGLEVPEPRRTAKQEPPPPSDLLERARGAAEKGRWNLTKEDENVSKCEASPEAVDVEPTQDIAQDTPPERQMRMNRGVSEERLSPLRWEFPPPLKASESMAPAAADEPCCDESDPCNEGCDEPECCDDEPECCDEQAQEECCPPEQT